MRRCFMILFDHVRVCRRWCSVLCFSAICCFQSCCSRQAYCVFNSSTIAMARTIAALKAQPGLPTPRVVKAAMKKGQRYSHSGNTPPFSKLMYHKYCKKIMVGTTKPCHPVFKITLVKIATYRAWQASVGIKARTNPTMSAINTLLRTTPGILTCGICRAVTCDGLSCDPSGEIRV